MGIITAKNLNLWYTANHALKDINIELPQKEITALIGPSGCGKSTFLKSLNRMNDLVEGCRIEGEICLDGVDLWIDVFDSGWRNTALEMGAFSDIGFGRRGQWFFDSHYCFFTHIGWSI